MRSQSDVSTAFSCSGFKTDTDISQKGPARRERELQAWQPAPDASAAAAPAPGHTDDLTFGPGASTGKISWDQFDANEKLFGVTTSFDEHAYTTPLNRDAPDYKEKEKKAQQLANEILGVRCNHPYSYLHYSSHFLFSLSTLSAAYHWSLTETDRPAPSYIHALFAGCY